MSGLVHAQRTVRSRWRLECRQVTGRDAGLTQSELLDVRRRSHRGAIRPQCPTETGYYGRGDPSRSGSVAPPSVCAEARSTQSTRSTRRILAAECGSESRPEASKLSLLHDSIPSRRAPQGTTASQYCQRLSHSAGCRRCQARRARSNRRVPAANPRLRSVRWTLGQSDWGQLNGLRESVVRAENACRCRVGEQHHRKERRHRRRGCRFSAYSRGRRSRVPYDASVRYLRRQFFVVQPRTGLPRNFRSEEHTSELQSLRHLVCRLLLEKKKKK